MTPSIGRARRHECAHRNRERPVTTRGAGQGANSSGSPIRKEPPLCLVYGSSRGGAVDWRTTRRVGMTSCRGASESGPCRSICAALFPFATSEWWTVVRPSCSASVMSSNPVTDTCPGTSMPRWRAAMRTPRASASVVQFFTTRRSVSRRKMALPWLKPLPMRESFPASKLIPVQRTWQVIPERK